jgi:hypothetical protein
MGEARWERVGALTGVLFVVFLVVSFAIVSDSPPQLDDPVADIRDFYVSNSSSLEASAYLTGIAAFFFLWFLGSLRLTLGRADPGGRLARIVMPAGALMLALALVNAAVNDVLAIRIAAESDQAVIRALYDLQAIAISFAAFPLAALVAATSVVSLRSRLLPPALTWLGLLLTPAWLLQGVALFVETGTFSPTGDYGLIVFLVWVAWVLALSGVLFLRAGVAERP